jgi:hypothetical protein
MESQQEEKNQEKKERWGGKGKEGYPQAGLRCLLDW